jgi:hypothetical protein
MNYEKIFDHSYERVKNISIDGKSFFAAFYEHFMALSPTARKHFSKIDMSQQIKMMEKSFYGLFIFYATKNANDYLEKVARQHSHSDLAISQMLFDVWMDALILTVKEYDSLYSNDISLSWRVVLSPGIAYMKYRFTE